MRAPAASVIVTSHARADHVGQAVRSIMRQSWQDWEMIIVDSGQHAAVRRVLQPFAVRDSRVRLLYGNYANVSEAANAGLAAARAPWVTFQDDDDVSHRHRLKHCLEILQRRPDLSGVLPQLQLFYDKTMRKMEVRRFTSHLKQGLLRRADLMAVGGFRPFFPLTEDTDLLHRLQERGCGFYALNKVLYYYRQYDGDQHLSHRLDRARYHLAVHISAWHRQEKRPDPVARKHANLDSVLARLAAMPRADQERLLNQSLFATYAEQLELAWQSGDDARREAIFTDMAHALRRCGLSDARIQQELRRWRNAVGAWAGGIHDFARALEKEDCVRRRAVKAETYPSAEDLFRRAQSLPPAQRDSLVRRFLLKACKARALQCLLSNNRAVLRRVRADARAMLQHCGYDGRQIRRILWQFSLSVHMRYLRQWLLRRA